MFEAVCGAELVETVVVGVLTTLGLFFFLVCANAPLENVKVKVAINKNFNSLIYFLLAMSFQKSLKLFVRSRWGRFLTNLRVPLSEQSRGLLVDWQTQIVVCFLLKSCGSRFHQ